MIELAHDGEEVWQLKGAIHARVTGEYLLHQRRAGSRQADDEYGGGVGISGTCPGGEKFRVEAFAHAAGLVLERRDVEWDGLAPPAIARRIMFEGSGVVVPVLEGAPEREMQVCLG